MHVPKYCTVVKLGMFFCFVFLSPQMSSASLYSVSPLVIDHNLEKRDIIEETITITNKEPTVIRVFPTVNEVSVSEGGGIQTFIEPSMTENRGTSITSWLEIGRGNIELKPGETRTIPLTIRISPEVEPGEYHAFIGFPEGSNRPDAEKKVREGSAPGTVLRIGVNTVQNQFLRLEKFSVDRFVKSANEGKALVGLSNPGDAPVVPKGEIIFYDTNGIEVNAVPINTDGVSIAPGATLELEQGVPNDMKMGKYKAFLSVEYGEHQLASLNDTTFFYVLPLKQLILIFAALLILAIMIALFVHRRYDVADADDDGVSDIAMFIRESRSESKDHDIDLSKKK